jgi:hypothetical protein
MGESLIEALLRRRGEERDRAVARSGSELVAGYLRCTVCSRRIRDDNDNRLCRACARSHRSGRKCRCGCGRPLDLRNVTGYARNCTNRRLPLVRREDMRVRDEE